MLSYLLDERGVMMAVFGCLDVDIAQWKAGFLFSMMFVG